MDVLISDTSVVIDLERAEIIEHILALPYRFVVRRYADYFPKRELPEPEKGRVV